MRVMTWVLGVGGAVALATAVVVAFLVPGTPWDEVRWILIGPTPFFAVGLWLRHRRPHGRAALWVLVAGVAYMISVALGDQLMPHFLIDQPWAWALSIVRLWADASGVVAGVALFGTFPDGRTERPYERWALWAVGVSALLLPLLYAITHPFMARGLWPNLMEPLLNSPLYVPATASAAGLLDIVHDGFLAWLLVAVVLLVLRYRRTSPGRRRRIRWLTFGLGAGVSLWGVQTLIGILLPDALLLAFNPVLYTVTLILTLGPLVLAIGYDGVLGIDRPTRRAVVYRTLWTLIAVLYVGAATVLGLTAAQYLRPATAVLLAAAAALLFQPVQRRLERLADRWVFGDRLDGYRVLTRFGAALESAPGPAELLTALAAAVREGLGLDWVRVVLGPGMTGTAGEPGEPALVVPLEGGRIECGPRRDGELVDEDRRLLLQLAGQATPAVRNLHLTAELTERLQTIRQQAAELAASRARMASAQDAERRRIQRDLHDGVQQDVVVLTAKLAVARERLRRGGDADRPLAELQEDLGRLLRQVREFAHTIHPPVLADQGLLEAVEAQASRLPLAVVVEADTALRGARYPQHVEAATWYVLSEALTNVVKHAHARQVSVTLRQPDGRLSVEIRDDGCGFDPGAARGLGLTGLADRVAIAHGTLRVDSSPGGGTTLWVEIPVASDA